MISTSFSFLFFVCETCQYSTCRYSRKILIDGYWQSSKTKVAYKYEMSILI